MAGDLRPALREVRAHDARGLEQASTGYREYTRGDLPCAYLEFACGFSMDQIGAVLPRYPLQPERWQRQGSLFL